MKFPKKNENLFKLTENLNIITSEEKIIDISKGKKPYPAHLIKKEAELCYC